jgi:hypothetical protein
LTEQQKIFENLSKLTEPKIRKLLKNYSEKEIGDSAILHGIGEHGIDVVTFVREINDPVGLRQVLLFQAKTKKITLGDWRKNLAGQLSEMYFRTISALNINENSPRRIILVYNEMNSFAHEAVSDWNRKMPVPVELMSLNALANVLEAKGYKAKDINRMST